MPKISSPSVIRLIGLLFALARPLHSTAEPVRPGLSGVAFQLGECRNTLVASIGIPVPPDTQISLTDGVTLHHYEETHHLYPLKAGQPVRVCLVNIATFCGSRSVNTRTYLLHSVYNPYMRRPQMLPDTASPCVSGR